MDADNYQGWGGGGGLLTTGWVVNDGLTTGFLRLLLFGGN